MDSHGQQQDYKPYVVCPLLLGWVQSTPSRASSTQHMWELVAGNWWLGTVQQFSHSMRLEGGLQISVLVNLCKTTIKVSDTLEHQPMVCPVPYTCTQPCHPGSGSHGQLFRLCQASSAWYRCRAAIGLQALSRLPFTAEAGVKHPFKRSSTRHMLELVAGNCMAFLPRHALRRWISSVKFACFVWLFRISQKNLISYNFIFNLDNYIHFCGIV